MEGACTERPAASGAKAFVSIARHAAQNTTPRVSLEPMGERALLFRCAMTGLGRRAGSCIQRQGCIKSDGIDCCMTCCIDQASMHGLNESERGAPLTIVRARARRHACFSLDSIDRDQSVKASAHHRSHFSQEMHGVPGEPPPSFAWFLIHCNRNE